jgi:hypothetical protein
MKLFARRHRALALAVVLASAGTFAVLLLPASARADEAPDAAEAVPSPAAVAPGAFVPLDRIGPDPSVHRLYIEGTEASERGDHVLALERFRAAHALSDRPYFLLLMAETLERTGRYSAALAMLDLYVEDEPDEAARTVAMAKRARLDGELRAAAARKSADEERADPHPRAALVTASAARGPAPTTGIGFIIGGGKLLGAGTLVLVRAAAPLCSYDGGGSCLPVIAVGVAIAGVGAALLGWGIHKAVKFAEWRRGTAPRLSILPLERGAAVSLAGTF